MFDFNDAGPQERPGRPDDRLARIKADLAARFEDALFYLLPGGRKNQSEFEAADTYGGIGRSLKVHLAGDKRGVWCDFATGETGSDLIDLWKAVKNVDFPAALDEIERYLGSGGFPRPARPLELVSSKEREPLPPPSKTWDYLDHSGLVIAQVRRYDLPGGGKDFRPWDAIRRKWAAPEPRPLYNLPGIAAAGVVVLVEGEKCADALIDLGITATTAMGGSNAPPGKTDWSPLSGKTVLIWPDNDEPGRKYAYAAQAAVQAAGGKPRVLQVPEGKPPKWDAADAAREGFDVAGFLAEPRPDPGRIDFSKWRVSRFAPGKAPSLQWLVANVFPLAMAGLFCAAGDTGKGFIGLDLALKVAGGFGEPSGVDGLVNPVLAFGNEVMARGTAVVLSAEDDEGVVWRRLEAIDPTGERRAMAGDRLVVVPLPNAGGPVPMVTAGRNGPATTAEFAQIANQLTAIRDLKLVLFDPMASFIQTDITTDPAAGAFATGILAALATRTGATVLVAHHMNKTVKEISGPESARAAIRGTTAIVDGVRFAYALWGLDEPKGKAVCNRLGEPWERGKVCKGAIVKANGPATREVHTWIRNGFGLLEVKNDLLRRGQIPADELLELLAADIAKAARLGRPFQISRANGLYERRDEMGLDLRDLSKHKFENLAKELLNAGRIVRATYKAGTKYLDVPGGQFAMGTGTIEPGFHDEK